MYSHPSAPTRSRTLCRGLSLLLVPLTSGCLDGLFSDPNPPYQPGMTCSGDYVAVSQGSSYVCMPATGEGGSCQEGRPRCADGLVCLPEARTCAVPAEVGEPCVTGQCLWDFCSGTDADAVCVEGGKVPAGGECEYMSDCATGGACDFVNDRRRCAPTPGLGDACDPGDWPEWENPCAEGVCRHEPGSGYVCVRFLPEGAVCDDTGPEPCEPDLVCLTDLGDEPRCGPRRTEGEPCEVGQCADSLACQEGRCSPE